MLGAAPAKVTLGLGALSVGNLAATFLFQWSVLTRLGPGIETDAFFAAVTVPQLVLSVVSGSLMYVLVPMLANESAGQFQKSVWSFFTLMGGLFLAIALTLYALATHWVPLIVPGFSEAGVALTVELTRIQLLGMVFTALASVQAAAFQASRKFIRVEASQLAATVASLALLAWLLPIYGVEAAAWLAVFGPALQVLLQAPALYPWAAPGLDRATLRRVADRLAPLLFGNAVYKTDPLIDRLLLSMSAPGSLSLFYFAQQILNAGIAILNRAVAVPMVPALSVLHGSGDRRGFAALCKRALLRVALFAGAAALALALVGREALALIVGYGGTITAGNVAELWLVMICLSGVFVGGALGLFSASAFYAMGNTSTPTRFGVYSFLLFVPGKIAAYMSYGVVGLAISTSCFTLLNFGLQYVFLNRAMGAAEGREP